MEKGKEKTSLEMQKYGTMKNLLTHSLGPPKIIYIIQTLIQSWSNMSLFQFIILLLLQVYSVLKLIGNWGLLWLIVFFSAWRNGLVWKRLEKIYCSDIKMFLKRFSPLMTSLSVWWTNWEMPLHLKLANTHSQETLHSKWAQTTATDIYM